MYRVHISSITLLLCCVAVACLSCGPGKYRAENYKRITRIQPNEADEFYNLGIAYSIVEREKDAVDAFQETIRRNPGDAEAYFRLGVMLSILGLNDEATNAYSKAFSLGRVSAKHYQLGLAYRILGRNEEAAAELEQAIAEREPHPLTSCYTIGLVDYDLERFEKALEAFNTALAINSSVAVDYYNVYYPIARTLDKLGREDDAVAAYREALRYRPDFIPAYLELGSLMATRGDFKAAQELYEKLSVVDAPSAAALHAFIEKKRK